MKDSAAKGIQNAKQTGQLRKDAAVQSKKGSVGKRESGSGLSSSTSSISGGSTSTSHSSSSISGINSRNTSRRMQNQRNINNAINVAKKIPVTRKYAQMAERIQKVKNSRAAGFFSSMMNKVNNKSDASADDIEEATRAEQAGEEYKPDAAEGRYTAITAKQMKILVVLVLAGIVVGAIFFCVILVSSLTDSGGKAYLASKSNPTEEELGEWYSNQSGSDADNSSSSTNSDSSTNTNSSVTASFNDLLSKGGINVNRLDEVNSRQLIIVDSNGTSASVSFYEKNGNEWSRVDSMSTSGYVGSEGTTDEPSETKSATPKGLYSVGDAFYQDSKPNTKLSTFKITSNTYWIDDPNSKYYNKRVEGTSNKDWNSAEHMSEISVYKYGFVINYNVSPVKKGAGSAMFFHISSNRPTGGCVSVPEDMLIKYLEKLDKSNNPYILII